MLDVRSQAHAPSASSGLRLFSRIYRPSASSVWPSTTLYAANISNVIIAVCLPLMSIAHRGSLPYKQGDSKPKT
jgi:hypothetical protein